MANHTTKTKTFKVRLVLLCLLLFICIATYLYLQQTQAFIYYYREQQQILLLDYDYLSALIKPIGGMVVLISQWLVQFFVLPCMGALVSTLLCLLTAVFLHLSTRILSNNIWWCLPLAFLPPVLFCVYLGEVYIHYDGLVAMGLGAISLWFYSILPMKRRLLRVGMGIVIVLTLFYLAGSVAVIIGIAILLLDLLRKEVKGRAYGSIPLVFVLFTGLIVYHQQWVVDAGSVFWINGYCEYYNEPSVLYSIIWLCIPLWVVIGWLVGKLKELAFWQQTCLSVCLLTFVAIVAFSSHKDHNHPAYNALLQQIHFADTEEWAKLTQVSGISVSNDIQMNYLNLALSKQGRLLDNLFAYQQKGIGSLITREDNYTDVSVLLSRIYYHIGAIGAAQNQAFSSNVGITYGNPSMAKLLVKTYLINGYYALAEKQISQLEKTKFYAEWASSQRRFLYNDAEVEADIELGAKRRGLSSTDRFTMLYGPVDDMVALLEANPDNNEAAEYLLSILLIAKDVGNINAFVEQYAGKGSMTNIPKRLQEAIAIIHEHEPEYCRMHGVSQKTMEDFQEFRQEYYTLRSQGKNTKTLARKYGRTFWYYMIQ